MISMKVFKQVFGLLFVLLSFNRGLLFCQTDSKASIENFGKSNDNSEYKLRLDRLEKYKSPLLSLKSKVYIDNYSEFILHELNQDVLQENLSRLKLRKDINSALVIYRDGLIKNDLGVFGEILGYTNTAAAIGLGIYHLVKYKKKYGIK